MLKYKTLGTKLKHWENRQQNSYQQLTLNTWDLLENILKEIQKHAYASQSEASDPKIYFFVTVIINGLAVSSRRL